VDGGWWKQSRGFVDFLIQGIRLHYAQSLSYFGSEELDEWNDIQEVEQLSVSKVMFLYEMNTGILNNMLTAAKPYGLYRPCLTRMKE